MGAYRYGFNGQEKTDEIAGIGNHTTAEFWEYDPRIGRRWNVDPVLKAYESSYGAFGNNPIVNIDPDGKDTINITRTTTRQRMPTIKSGLDNVPSKKIPDIVSTTGNININAADGNDVFRFTDVNTTIDENGNSTTTSTTTTLNLNNEQTFYRTGGHNVKGYIDDRYALADIAPKWLLNFYAKSGDIGVKSALAYQKDVPFANALQKITNTVYLVSGAYGVARMTLGPLLTTAAGESSFFAGTKYTTKVWQQMQLGDYHAFPEGVAAFEKYGARSIIKGGDGIEREMLKIPGAYDGKNGVFEFIKESDGSINHRLFRAN